MSSGGSDLASLLVTTDRSNTVRVDQNPVFFKDGKGCDDENETVDSNLKSEGTDTLGCDAATNTSGIAYIDEDEYTDEDNNFAQSFGIRKVADRNIRCYRQGNITHELHALNEDPKKTTISSVRQNSEIEPLGDQVVCVIDSNSINSHFGANANRSTLKKADYADNSFRYTSGKYHVHGSRQGSYDMTQSRTSSANDYGSTNSSAELRENIETVPLEGIFTDNLRSSPYTVNERYISSYLQPTESAYLHPPLERVNCRFTFQFIVIVHECSLRGLWAFLLYSLLFGKGIHYR
ncbi:hypothetical protein AB6A40_007238 [Gnathostoma spinigerum]|uniref:Uncharacterized protein n=1 Tax=Gnathostoma spinigerum TaxID=75299 RepID=A0ABD6EQS6_9BILA